MDARYIYPVSLPMTLKNLSTLVLPLLITGAVSCKKDDNQPVANRSGLIKTLRTQAVDSPQTSNSYLEQYQFTYFPDGTVETVAVDYNWSAWNRQLVLKYQRYSGYFLRTSSIDNQPATASVDSFTTTTDGRIIAAYYGIRDTGLKTTGRFDYNAQNQLTAYTMQRGGSSLYPYTFSWDGPNLVRSRGYQMYDTRYLYDSTKSMQEADYFNITSLIEWGQPVLRTKYHTSNHKSPLNNDMLTNIQWENGRISSYQVYASQNGIPRRYFFTYY